ncbi:MAG TPA: PHP domain-containing protein, partial [Bacteroidales bacterium]|nr:PHP domain-containing protein [Bacteroidales bacterium]
MHLNCHSWYSLRYGTLSVDSLVGEAVANGAGVLALTDINNSTGIPEFVSACTEAGITPIAGIEFRKDDRLLYTGLAANNDGFRNLNEFLTHHNLNGLPLPDLAPPLDNVFFIYPLSNGFNRQSSIGNRPSLIGLRPSELTPLVLSRYRDLVPRMVVMAPVTFRNRKDYELHRNFRAVDHNVLLSRLTPDQVAAPDEVILSREAWERLRLDFPDIVSNTVRLAEACSIGFDFRSCKNRKTFTGDPYDDRVLLG